VKYNNSEKRLTKFVHYPDFIAVTTSGKILLLETKGNKWAELAGKNSRYFMLFDKASVEGAYTLDKVKELIRQL